MGMEGLEECLFPLTNMEVPPTAESYLCEIEKIPFSPVQSWLKSESNQGRQLPTVSPDYIALQSGDIWFI